MKKLTLMLLFIGFFSKAEQICRVFVVPTESYDAEVYIRENCIKNDILSVISTSDSLALQSLELKMFLQRFCRFDREIIFRQSGKAPKQEEMLICTLNDTLPRIYRKG
jgi:hypothetical protein